MEKSETLIEKLKSSARSFFRGVYGGNPSVVDELAGENIVATYPIFESIFGTSSIRGIEAYRNHAANFNANWTDTQVTIHQVIAEDLFVVLTWSFSGRRSKLSDGGELSMTGYQSWGGITLIEFDKNGKIISEIGEESEPGPIERLAASKPNET